MLKTKSLRYSPLNVEMGWTGEFLSNCLLLMSEKITGKHFFYLGVSRGFQYFYISLGLLKKEKDDFFFFFSLKLSWLILKNILNFVGQREQEKIFAKALRKAGRTSL